MFVINVGTHANVCQHCSDCTAYSLQLNQDYVHSDELTLLYSFGSCRLWMRAAVTKENDIITLTVELQFRVEEIMAQSLLGKASLKCRLPSL